jgi:hypothetical protein
MKKLIFLLGFLFMMYGLTGQPWPSIIGEYGVLEEGRQIIEHYDHGFLITSSRGYGYDLHSGLIVKTNINGQVLWDKEIGIAPDQIMIDKTLYDEEGNIYVFGLIIQNTQNNWPVVIKLNACGEKVWCKNLYNPDFYFGYFKDAMLLDNGDLLGLAYYPDEDQHDIIFLFCLSPDGQYKWKKSYASCDNYPDFANRTGNSIDKFGDMYVISGYVYSPYPNGNPEHCFLRPMFIGIDEEFREKWVVEYGIADSMLGNADAAIAINDTLFMGVGRYRFSDENGRQTNNSWMMFFNDKGEQKNYKLIVNETLGQNVINNAIYDVEHIENDRYLVTSVYQFDNEELGFGEMVVDTSGNVFNHTLREFAGGANYYLTKTFDNKYVGACCYRTSSAYEWDIYLNKFDEDLVVDTLYPGNYTYDSLCPHAIQSGVIDLTGCDVVTGIGEIPTLEEYRENIEKIKITAIPNPSSTGEVVLEFENTVSFTNTELRVYDAFGREIVTKAVLSGQGALRLDTSGWADGIYFAVIFSTHQPIGRCKFMINQ